MSKKNLSVMLILALIFFLVGCAYPVTRRRLEVAGWHGSWKGEQPIYLNALGREIDKENLTKKAREYVNTHPELTEEVKRALIGLRIREEMRQEEVKLIWGEPDKIIKIKPDANMMYEEKWIYNCETLISVVPVFVIPEYYTLYFQNKVLMKCEETRAEEL